MAIITDYILFDRGCMSCKQTSGNKSSVHVFNFIEDSDDEEEEEEEGDNKKIYDEIDILNVIQNHYIESPVACPFCSTINNFKFFNISVNGIAVRRQIFSTTQKKYVSDSQNFSIKFEKITYLGKNDAEKIENTSLLYLEESELRCDLQIRKTKFKSNLYIYQYSISDTTMELVFFGKIDEIKYTENGEINFISGYENNIDEKKRFKITKNVFSIGDYNFINHDNLYLEVDNNCNFLLSNTLDYGAFEL